ncbi:hypothetical protein BDN72DRAFT_527796 [Pluteus cervinus]|uniref:Uncharacterized protein n=1 Tax=Pluteus cervinus TaxID=181527 RepID=A0ACD3AYB8_9AGAR|nr:hypothetical protein BDN72DRAFT_527796 [Pluteus cervinus]
MALATLTSHRLSSVPRFSFRKPRLLSFCKTCPRSKMYTSSQAHQDCRGWRVGDPALGFGMGAGYKLSSLLPSVSISRWGGRIYSSPSFAFGRASGF